MINSTLVNSWDQLEVLSERILINCEVPCCFIHGRNDCSVSSLVTEYKLGRHGGVGQLELFRSTDSYVEVDTLTLGENASLNLNSLDASSGIGNFKEVVTIIHVHKRHKIAFESRVIGVQSLHRDDRALGRHCR